MEGVEVDMQVGDCDLANTSLRLQQQQQQVMLHLLQATAMWLVALCAVAMPCVSGQQLAGAAAFAGRSDAGDGPAAATRTAVISVVFQAVLVTMSEASIFK